MGHCQIAWHAKLFDFKQLIFSNIPFEDDRGDLSAEALKYKEDGETGSLKFL